MSRYIKDTTAPRIPVNFTIVRAAFPELATFLDYCPVREQSIILRRILQRSLDEGWGYELLNEVRLNKGLPPFKKEES